MDKFKTTAYLMLLLAACATGGKVVESKNQILGHWRIYAIAGLMGNECPGMTFKPHGKGDIFLPTGKSEKFTWSTSSDTLFIDFNSDTRKDVFLSQRKFLITRCDSANLVFSTLDGAKYQMAR